MGATTAADEAVASPWRNFFADDRATAAGSVGATTAADEAVASCNLNGGGHNFLSDDCATAAGSVGATTAADDEAVACAWRLTLNGGGHDGCLGRIGGLAFPVGMMGGKAAGSGAPTAATAASAASVAKGCGLGGSQRLQAAGATSAGSARVWVGRRLVANLVVGMSMVIVRAAGLFVDDRHCGTGCWPLMLLAGGRGGVLGASRFRSPLGDALSAG